MAMREGINWGELWVMEESRRVWGDPVRGKLALVQVGDATASAYANYGAGRSPALTRAARGIKAEEIALRCTAVARHVLGRDNPVAGAPSRFTLKATR